MRREPANASPKTPINKNTFMPHATDTSCSIDTGFNTLVLLAPISPCRFYPAQYGYRLLDALPVRLTRVVLQAAAESGVR